MKAVVYKGNGQIALEEHSVPAIVDERDAIVKETLTTICSGPCRERSSGMNLSAELWRRETR